jgi:hypothetical protein
VWFMPSTGPRPLFWELEQHSIFDHDTQFSWG